MMQVSDAESVSYYQTSNRRDHAVHVILIVRHVMYSVHLTQHMDSYG